MTDARVPSGCSPGLLKVLSEYISLRSPLSGRPEVAGAYRSLFAGRGLEFSELKPCFPGEDSRYIDWNSTLRFPGSVYRKGFTEEQENPVVLAIDCSASLWALPRVRQAALETAAILFFCAEQNRDPLGLSLFSSQEELFLPPVFAPARNRRLLSRLLRFTPRERRTRLDLHLQALLRRSPPFCRILLISDFLADGWQPLAERLAMRHDLVCAAAAPDMPGFDRPGCRILAADPEDGAGTEFSPVARRRHLEDVEGFFRRRRLPFLRLSSSPLRDLLRFYRQGGPRRR